jgi:GTPase SAR1 family protein
MGITKSRSIDEKTRANLAMSRHDEPHPPTVTSSSTLASFIDMKFHLTCPRQLFRRRRRSTKRKVLILGLNGIGKTDLFTRLVAFYTPTLASVGLVRPTIGESSRVESPERCPSRTTNNMRKRRRWCHASDQITLWDCGGEPSMQSLWSYHYPSTSLLVWLVNAHDRSRCDTSLELLTQVLAEPLLHRVPVLIIVYHLSFDPRLDDTADEHVEQQVLTKFEVAFRFLSLLPTCRASSFQWQVINVTPNENMRDDMTKVEQCFRHLMKL